MENQTEVKAMVSEIKRCMFLLELDVPDDRYPLTYALEMERHLDPLYLEVAVRPLGLYEFPEGWDKIDATEIHVEQIRSGWKPSRLTRIRRRLSWKQR